MLKVFDRYFAFQPPSPQSDGQGGEEEGWGTPVNARAAVQNLRGRESVIAARLAGVQPIVITVWEYPETSLITPEWRAEDLDKPGTFYDLTSAVVSEDRKYIEITAQTGATG